MMKDPVLKIVLLFSILLLLVGCTSQSATAPPASSVVEQAAETLPQPAPSHTAASAAPTLASIKTTTPTAAVSTNSALQCNASGDPGIRVLFIGNSLTYSNDLPDVFAKLSCSGGQNVTVGMSAEPGWTLSQHAASSVTLRKIKKEWDIVVLQENSQIPTDPEVARQKMYPAARTLTTLVAETGADVLFFQNWGSRDGLTGSSTVDFRQLQERINDSFFAIAEELQAPIAPVGEAFQIGVNQSSPVNPWQNDGLHPNQTGTYLAACVFYATIFHESPVDLAFHFTFSSNEASRLQEIADQAVFGK